MLIIKEFKSTDLIDLKTVREINNLVYDSDIKERFDFGDFLYLGFIDDKLVAIEIFRLEKFDDGEVIPRFIHIIYHPCIKRSKQVVVFLVRNERSMIRNGYNRVWAYILKNRMDMVTLARKFGFKDIEFNGDGYTLIKKIGV